VPFLSSRDFGVWTCTALVSSGFTLNTQQTEEAKDAFLGRCLLGLPFPFILSIGFF